VAQDRIQWGLRENGSIKGEMSFLTSWATIFFSRRILLHGIVPLFFGVEFFMIMISGICVHRPISNIIFL
jgi:hypothetical protein